MIEYIKNKNIDKTKWDDCIQRSQNGLIYAYSWYLDKICTGWDALVEDNYTSVMPLSNNKKFGITYIYPPAFVQQLGVFSTQAITEEKVSEFLNSIPKHFKYVEMNLNEQNPFTPKSGFSTRQFLNILLDLSPGYNSIASNYSTQTARNLKKAQSSKLTLADYIKPQRIITLFRENKGKEIAISDSHYEALEKLMDEVLKRKLGKSKGVYNNELKLCAGAFFLESNNRIIFLFSGANESAYQNQAMTLLINNVIEESYNSANQKNEYSPIFDFEGSNDLNLARFYKGFGAKESTYLQVRKNMLPQPLKLIKEFQLKKKMGT